MAVMSANVQAWSVEERAGQRWSCHIREADSVCAVCWSPDSRNILTTVSLLSRICVWSLHHPGADTHPVRHILHVRVPLACGDAPDFCHAPLTSTTHSHTHTDDFYQQFSPDGTKFAVIESSADEGNAVSVFCTATWQRVLRIDPKALRTTTSVGSRQLGSSTVSALCWHPHAYMFCVRDDWQLWRLQFFDVAGTRVASLHMDGGACRGGAEAARTAARAGCSPHSLGIMRVQWCRAARLILALDHARAIVLVSERSWSMLARLAPAITPPPSQAPQSSASHCLLQPQPLLCVYALGTRPVCDSQVDLLCSTNSRNGSNLLHTHLDSLPAQSVYFRCVSERPINLAVDVNKMMSAGVLANANNSLCRFSPDGTFVASTNPFFAGVVFVWRMLSLSLCSVLLCEHTVTDLSWSRNSHLVFCFVTASHGCHVGVWHDAMHVPACFSVPLTGVCRVRCLSAPREERPDQSTDPSLNLVAISDRSSLRLIQLDLPPTN